MKEIFDPRSGKPRKTLDQILSRYTVLENGCWEWNGTRNNDGYGFVCLMIGGKQSGMSAHRLQWVRFNGPIEDGADVCHTCDHRSCINPDHLWNGTALDNIHDMIAKGRQNFTGLKNYGKESLSDRYAWSPEDPFRKP